MLRAPAVAGSFYPGSADVLERAVDGFIGSAPASRVACAIVVPHAGYLYSGGVAGAVYGAVEVPHRCIVLGPNHTGAGPRRSVDVDETWRTPLGDVAVDVDFARTLVGRAGLARDTRAHAREHSIEVQLPFLQRRNPAVRIVPICLSGLSADACEEVGATLAEAIVKAPGPTLLVASTDMSHYVPAAEAKRLDHLALAEVERLDARGLYRTVAERDITMCGFIPTAVTVAAARALGAAGAALVRYGHSGETSGDHDHVVGYAGLVIA